MENLHELRRNQQAHGYRADAPGGHSSQAAEHKRTPVDMYLRPPNTTVAYSGQRNGTFDICQVTNLPLHFAPLITRPKRPLLMADLGVYFGIALVSNGRLGA